MNAEDVKFRVYHCSATPPSQDIGADEIRKMHMDAPNNWSDIGYHYVIRRNGKIETGRSVIRPGAHVRGHNYESIGICLVGGVNEVGDAVFNYTAEQILSMIDIDDMLKVKFYNSTPCGHRDFSPDKNNDGIIDATERLKECPCFDAKEFFIGI